MLFGFLIEVSLCFFLKDVGFYGSLLRFLSVNPYKGQGFLGILWVLEALATEVRHLAASHHLLVFHPLLRCLPDHHDHGTRPSSRR